MADTMTKQNKDEEIKEQGNGSELSRGETGVSFVPDVDILESEKGVKLYAEMPGVDEGSLEIVLNKDELTIHGQTADESSEGYNLVYSEYETGVFHRAFTIGRELDPDNISAVVRNGVLELTLPKAAEAQARRIEVQAG